MSPGSKFTRLVGASVVVVELEVAPVSLAPSEAAFGVPFGVDWPPPGALHSRALCPTPPQHKHRFERDALSIALQV